MSTTGHAPPFSSKAACPYSLLWSSELSVKLARQVLQSQHRIPVSIGSSKSKHRWRKEVMNKSLPIIPWRRMATQLHLDACIHSGHDTINIIGPWDFGRLTAASTFQRRYCLPSSSAHQFIAKTYGNSNSTRAVTVPCTEFRCQGGVIRASGSTYYRAKQAPIFDGLGTPFYFTDN